MLILKTFAQNVISLFEDLEYNGPLPQGIEVMNPFRDNPHIMPVITEFYTKYYSDNNTRHLILGINPGRFGAGITGIPFTDTKRMSEKCGLSIPGIQTFETSSVFVYEMIDAFGGVEKFYSKFFISSVSPLGFTSANPNGSVVNYNYYDSRKLTEDIYPFVIESLSKQLQFGIERDTCFCLGTGQNYKYVLQLNEKLKLFNKIVPLEHPRYVMQYKSKQKQKFIDKYLEEFLKV